MPHSSPDASDVELEKVPALHGTAMGFALWAWPLAARARLLHRCRAADDARAAGIGEVEVFESRVELGGEALANVEPPPRGRGEWSFLGRWGPRCPGRASDLECALGRSRPEGPGSAQGCAAALIRLVADESRAQQGDIRTAENEYGTAGLCPAVLDYTLVRGEARGVHTQCSTQVAAQHHTGQHDVPTHNLERSPNVLRELCGALDAAIRKREPASLCLQSTE
eukprot:1238363-Prymnesium_polylepis.2